MGKDRLLIERYLLSLKKRDYAQQTVIGYSKVLEEFYSFSLENKFEFCKLTTEHADHWFLILRQRHAASATVNTWNSIVRVFYNYLLSEGLVLRNLFLEIDPLKSPFRPRSIVSIRELEKLFSCIESNPGIPLRDVAIFETFYGTGMTSNELRMLKISHLNFHFEEVTVVNSRTGHERIIPLPAGTVYVLRQYMAGRKLRWHTSDMLFPNPEGKQLSASYPYHIIKGFLKLTSSPQNGPATLRNSYANHLLTSGADLVQVRNLLGHRSVAATVLNDDNYAAQIKLIYNRSHPKAF